MLAFTRLNTLFFFVFGILLVGSSAHTTSPRHNGLNALDLQTNAARMEAGLPPLRPRNLFNPSRVARSPPKPSGFPNEVCNKRIKVLNTYGGVVGYIAKTQSNGAFKVDKSGWSGNHLQIKYTPSSNPFNVLIESFGSGSKPTLGFGGKNSNLNTSNNYNVLTGTNSLASGSTPVNNANSLSSSYGRSYAESAVWSVSGNRLTAIWVNPGRLTVSTDFYVTSSNELIQVATGISPPGGSSKVAKSPYSNFRRPTGSRFLEVDAFGLSESWTGFLETGSPFAHSYVEANSPVFHVIDKLLVVTAINLALDVNRLFFETNS
ncbi:hypothetical protein JR316_0000094 [Psilocybe cubensis]|uniref:Uncharacterized protein n=1 Tax=Psilocybe cubensis TaxID=181762 RepID=A0ACB8HE79_PSICU|nr:hypothetical protein JR316_0000094 [Psilocybe cubensis]KAH9486030.1 hypothetical protein JR316_0000094 [Psilocybe cubensis]